VSRAGTKKFIRAGTVTAALLTGMLALGAGSPAWATGWKVNQGHTPKSGNLYWALTYGPNLTGAEFGMGACDPGKSQNDLGAALYLCTGFDGTDTGYDQVVRNNAHSIASTGCYGSTTWVYANFTGNYNYVDANWYGTLNSKLANNVNSAGIGSEC
jgi:hypothetical protein